jgi:hypothetical protein
MKSPQHVSCSPDISIIKILRGDIWNQNLPTDCKNP